MSIDISIYELGSLYKIKWVYMKGILPCLLRPHPHA